MSEALYPPGPAEVPADLTAPTAAYKRHAWLAFGAVVGFVGFYLSLTGWFGWVGYKLIRDSAAGGQLWLGVVMSIPFFFLFVFLAKGLFTVRHSADPGQLEVTEEEEPELFAFVNRIADEAGAPRPHRIFLSARVNAAVFYDLSLLNLILPSKKNLEIGLGLVNALSLDELKAVVAHEFGHFAQRTMAVGRYVYIAQQVVGDVVGSRGVLDRFLMGLSYFDLRVAWIGWIMRLFVWALRALVDTAFRGIILAQRALSREMELQADLVSVSLAGSDSLVHALHRLHAADDAWNRALSFAGSHYERGQAAEDFFAVQSRMQHRMGEVLADDTYGEVPDLPADRSSHRVFDDALAQPPQMWSTHPPNRQREDNAKRVYLPSVFDDRSAWALFREPDARRRQLTTLLYTQANEPRETQMLRVEECIGAVDELFERPWLEPRYQGLYYSRSPFREVREIGGLDTVPDPLAALDDLYQPAVREDLETLREREEELALLQGLEDGLLHAPGGVIRYRGEDMPRQQLPALKAHAEEDARLARERVLAHDRACRSVHLALAETLGNGWPEYLESLAALAHYGTHGGSDLEDANDFMGHTWMMVTADGNISANERIRLIHAGEDLERVMSTLWSQRKSVAIPAELCHKLGAPGWEGMLEDSYTFVPPTDGNLPSWFENVGGWVDSFARPLRALANVALETLLEAEDQVASLARAGGEVPPAPPKGGVPKSYRTCTTDQERVREKKLPLWDRFILADGWGPGTARASAALGVLAVPFYVTTMATASTVVVYNGLATSVQVDLDGDQIQLAAGAHRELQVDATVLAISTQTTSGRPIEELSLDATNTWSTQVYNIAGAAPLVRWTRSYGTAAEVGPAMLGAPRVLETGIDFLFEDPPESVSTKSSGATRRSLAAAMGSPANQLDELDEDEAWRVVKAHLDFDDPNNPAFTAWAQQGGAREMGIAVLAGRIAEDPGSVPLRRAEHDLARMSGEEEAVCADRRAAAERRPDDPDALYLATRCLDGGPARAGFLEGHAAYPDHPWLGMASAFAHMERGEWTQALDKIERFEGLTHTDLGLDRARIQRVLGRRVTSEDSWVLFNEALASSQRLPDFFAPHQLLYEGHLKAAMTQALTDPEQGDLLAKLAASDGAPRPVTTQLLSKAPIDSSPIGWYLAAAVHAREGRSIDAYRPLLEGDLPDESRQAVLALFEEDGLSDPDALDRAVLGLRTMQRGLVYAAGLVILQDKAPAHWKRDAKTLLLPFEHPYFEG